MSSFHPPRLYAIIDASCFLSFRAENPQTYADSQRGNPCSPPTIATSATAPRSAPTPALVTTAIPCHPERSEGPAVSQLLHYAQELVKAGVTLIQYRNKTATAREILSHARELRRILPPDVTFFLNDRADLALAANADGVHVGQDDLSPEGARLVVGNTKLIGVSTHNRAQLEIASQAPVDYIAIGPIFSTRSKANPDPVVGLDGLRKIRKLTTKPLIAIGGITRENCRSVIEAGADSVAVIADLLADPKRHAEQFLQLLG
ncbi:MAG TPA: thiamine phosphate synthase [Candidatus Koribacter sp.]|jgi:thiamine-phosphate pyrophosphorylase